MGSPPNRRHRAAPAFKDHFSSVAADYRTFRPRYPRALFRLLAARAPQRGLAWDCATGSGQAALGLARHFRQVVASDASARQIASAPAHPRIAYRVEPAEQTGFGAHTVDVVTVGQALHWFDLEAFYAEVRRVLRPGGLIGVWCYGLLRISPAVDRVVQRFHDELLADHWPAERRLVEQGYAGLPFPFQALPTPHLRMVAYWQLPQLLGYLGTWSAVHAYQARHGIDPREHIRGPLHEAWGPERRTRKLRWPLTLRLGRHG